MLSEYDPAAKAPESTAEWVRNFREIPQLPLILKRFYPARLDQERLMDRAAGYITSYAAWETVRLGRASQVVGNPYHAQPGGGELPFTGFEGYLAGTRLDPQRRVRLIAQTGDHFRQTGRLVFGNDKMMHVEELLNARMQAITAFADMTVKSLLITADTLFNWARRQLKDHVDRDEAQYVAFKSVTYDALQAMPEAYYIIDPITLRLSLSVPLPRPELVRHGSPYPVELSPAERRGYAFMLALSHAASPALAAAVQDMLNPLEHIVEAYY